MAKADIPVVKRSLYSWVFASNFKLQILLFAIILITVLARVAPLELQKRIVNEAIGQYDFELLLNLCSLYLLAVVAASGLKFLINLLQTLIGQRTLAAMRKALYHHILTLPLGFFRKTQPGMVVSSLVTEIASAGDFIGQALAVPVTNILTLSFFAGYLIWQNWLLAIVSLSIYPIIIFLVPQLQRRANQANKERVDATRDISSLIGESIAGIHEIQGNGAFRIENRKYDKVVDRLLRIRIIWNLYRFGVKVTNNFFNNLGPFLIFLLGGWLVMRGQLNLGELVVFLSAQEKIYEPWRELLDYYQAYQDATVRYRRTMEYFDAEAEHTLEPVARAPYDLGGDVEVKNLSFVTDSGIVLLDNISFSLKQGESLALVGFSGSGKSTLAQCIGQLYKYTDGQVWVGGQEVAELSKKDMIRTAGIVSQSPFIFEGTIRENLLYACMARDDIEATDHPELPTRDDLIAVLQQTGIFVDVLRFGLNATLNRHDEEMKTQITRVRENFQRDFGESLAEYVEFFDNERYLYHSSIAENLIFGSADTGTYERRNLSRSSVFTAFLDQADLTRPLLMLGSELARQTVDILGNLPPERIFFEQSPIEPDELEVYKPLVERMRKRRLHELSVDEWQKLLDLALRFIPGEHKMVALPPILETLILEGRSMFRAQIETNNPEAISFYDIRSYIEGETILNNVFFGKTTTKNVQVQEKINQSIIQLLIEEDFLETILEIGMSYNVGTKGDKLSGGQRQKLAIARMFLKAPQLLIMDEATSALDNRSQARIQNLLESRWKGHSTIISVVHRLDTIRDYDRIAVLKAGKIREMGTYQELIDAKGVLYELIGKN